MVGELRDPVTTAKTKERLLILPTLRLLVEAENTTNRADAIRLINRATELREATFNSPKPTGMTAFAVAHSRRDEYAPFLRSVRMVGLRLCSSNCHRVTPSQTRLSKVYWGFISQPHTGYPNPVVSSYADPVKR
jgi:hypothetical protein